jgi:hypothetical protein
VYYPEQWLKAAADFDERNKYNDEEAYEIELHGDEERTQAWIDHLEDFYGGGMTNDQRI